MGCGDACPILPGRRYEEWLLLDPAGFDLASVRPIRDEIEQHVRKLLADLVAMHPNLSWPTPGSPANGAVTEEA